MNVIKDIRMKNYHSACPKDQIRKIVLFFHTNRTKKKFFQTSPDCKTPTLFPYFTRLRWYSVKNLTLNHQFFHRFREKNLTWPLVGHVTWAVPDNITPHSSPKKTPSLSQFLDAESFPGSLRLVARNQPFVENNLLSDARLWRHNAVRPLV